MKKIIALSAIIFAFAGCKKDGASGPKPVISFKSATTLDVPAEMDAMAFTLRVQDGDGDINSIFVNDDRYTGDSTVFDELYFPDLESHAGGKLDADLELVVSDRGDNVFLRLREGDLTTRPNPDTMHIRIYVKDKKNNTSDTIRLPKVAIHR